MGDTEEKNDKRAGESYACGLFFEYHFSVEFSGSQVHPIWSRAGSRG